MERVWRGVPWIDPPEGEAAGGGGGGSAEAERGGGEGGGASSSLRMGADFLSETGTGSRISHSYCRCGTHHVNGRREGTAPLPPRFGRVGGAHRHRSRDRNRERILRLSRAAAPSATMLTPSGWIRDVTSGKALGRFRAPHSLNGSGGAWARTAGILANPVTLLKAHNAAIAPHRSPWRRSTRQRRAGRHVNGWQTAGPPVAKPPQKSEACYRFFCHRVWMEGPHRVASFSRLLFQHSGALSSSVDTVRVKRAPQQ
ncbi:hypothetical protein GW17_00039772 [Ensete ventricosum]|nr:hypothetical protein GW17_00039772 [Ensete ventricosum]